MFGRRGIERPTDEAALNPYRQRFAAMFARLRSEHGVRFFLAHNMTVTPTQRRPDRRRSSGTAAAYGFGLFSFQPAAFIGDDRRWHEGYRDTTADTVWAQVEAGAGTRLPFRALQVGDERCNRTTYGFYVGDDYFPILDEREPADLAVRDAFFTLLRRDQLLRHTAAAAAGQGGPAWSPGTRAQWSRCRGMARPRPPAPSASRRLLRHAASAR